jgi:hypothetical protein
MGSLKTKAEELRIGLIAGVYEVADVIQWADSEIVQLEKPPLALLDLAMMSKAKAFEVVSQLNLIPGEVDTFFITRRLLGKMYFTLKEHPEEGWKLSKYLYRLYVDLGTEVTADLQFMAIMDDAYELAIHNIWGTEREVYQELLECLKPFAEEGETPPAHRE